jgi:hypothetical protein
LRVGFVLGSDPDVLEDGLVHQPAGVGLGAEVAVLEVVAGEQRALLLLEVGEEGCEPVLSGRNDQREDAPLVVLGQAWLR